MLFFVHFVLNTDSFSQILDVFVVHYSNRLGPHELPVSEFENNEAAYPVRMSGFQVAAL